LSPTTVDNTWTIEDAVAALTAPVPGAPDARAAWQQQSQRAATDFDEKVAETIARGLLDVLCRDFDDRRSLEALIVLGLAHARVLERHRATFANEGRRLALLLERAGEADRARALLEELAARMPNDPDIDRDLTAVLRRTGGANVIVERYLRRAEEAVASGKPMDAIMWLQEIVLIDRNRRDVARMIRDLRFQEKERKSRASRRVKIALVVLLLVGGVVAVWMRERQIAEQFASIAPAAEANLASLKAREQAIDQLVDEQHAWLGMFPVLQDKRRLAMQIVVLEEQAAKIAHDAAIEKARLEDQAEDARTRGLAFAERGQFDSALADFHRALELSTPSWEHRARVQADIDAIEAWRKKSR
jgi:tetratricopeptide (TPR) repeat protein